ncbi:MAG TPA: hypothetical protein VKX39_14395 [Bryobacteraceae bacterium]|jgi:hypothetical protein|nr:hypothetical protein [Bryobacteraceae bacterium]
MNFVRYSCLLFAGAALSLAQAPVPAVAAVQTTGMVGIADSQTARFNVLNPGAVAPALGVICSATISFLDANNSILKSASVSVTPGKSAFLDLHSDTDLALATGDRAQIRAIVSQPLTPGPTPVAAPQPVCKLIPTLEIFDTVTGRTLVVLGHVTPVP